MTITTVNQSELEVCQQTLLKTEKTFDEFLYIIAHDFNAQLRHIEQFSGLLELQLEDSLDEESRIYLSYVKKSALRLKAMLAGLRVLSDLTLDTNKVECDTNKVVAEVVRELDQKYHDKNIDVQVAELPILLCDETQFVFIIRELLENAILYCDEQTQPKISVDTKIEDNMCHFYLTDNAIGIDFAQHDAIFDPFFQLQTDIKKSENIGLGLTYCQRIAANHGGHAWVESSDTQPPLIGSTFAFNFMLNEACSDKTK